MTLHRSELVPAPGGLASRSGGAVSPGVYAGAIDDLSTATWDGSCGPLSPRRLQRKGWMYVGLFAPQYMMGFAVVDAGYLATAFVYVYDRTTGRLIEHRCARPWGFDATFAPDWRRSWSLRSGRRYWQIDHDGMAWQLACSAPGLQLVATVADHRRGISAVSSAPGRPFHHTYKLGGLAAEATLTRDGRSEHVAARASVDFSLGYPPRETCWNWASLDGVTDDGQPVAINLVAHFLNGLENALWMGDEVIPLAQAVFRYTPENPLAPWQISTMDDRLSLMFVPEGQRQEHRDAGVVSSRFSQPFGRYSGHLETPSGGQAIHGYGVVEAHQARW
jgi:hypothetical protein